LTTRPSDLADLAGRDPGDLALVDDTHALTWAQLDRRTHAIGRGLEAAGLKPGDHVAMVVTNRTEFVESLLGILRAGMLVTPVKTNWKPGEIAYLLQDAGSRCVISDVDSADEAAHDLGLPLIEVGEGFAAWAAAQDPTPLPQGRAGHRVAYTSGTTGQPKGVERINDVGMPFEQFVTASAQGATGLGLPSDGVHLMVSQLIHGAPMNFGISTMLSGATLRIMARWDADRAIDLLSGEVTASIMVPTMFRQLLALPEHRRAQLQHEQFRCILPGGEGCSVELKRKMIDWWGPVFTEYYGFTEGGMTLATSEEWMERPGTVGRPFTGQTVEIIDEHGSALPAGEVGTVYFRRTEGRIFRYKNADSKTEAAYRADNSFTVGDMGYLDEDGYLYLTGRSAELIVAAGVNVYPAEIEAVVFEVIGVVDACVVGGPDPERGEQPVAFVVIAPGHDPEDVRAAIDATCATELAGYKRPRRIEVCDGIPRDPTGKTLRVKLRQTLWPDVTA
jgi:acyl-CoA synthetase (AMP-forming)/AMP-acid ligase II